MTTETIISRKDALALNRAKFFTGKPCKFGHVAYRYVASGNCVDCARQYSLQWNGKAARCPPGAVEVPAQVLHPEDAARLYAWIDATNAARGFPPARRPEVAAEGQTAWEQMLALEMRRPARNRPSLAYLLQAAATLGIPETYGAGRSRPVDDWTPTPEQVRADRDARLSWAAGKGIGHAV